MLEFTAGYYFPKNLIRHDLDNALVYVFCNDGSLHNIMYNYSSSIGISFKSCDLHMFVEFIEKDHA